MPFYMLFLMSVLWLWSIYYLEIPLNQFFYLRRCYAVHHAMRLVRYHSGNQGQPGRRGRALERNPHDLPALLCIRH